MPNNSISIPLNRIEKVLAYIEKNLDQPLTVKNLADKSSWSRWQFQRVFNSATGLSVALYVRELRLSRSAEMLITTSRRQLDIALSCGFDSEVSFNRAFKKMFNCTPGFYRRRNLYIGIKTPLKAVHTAESVSKINHKMVHIRIESRPGFTVSGVRGEINGILSDTPNFSTKVPQLWKQFGHQITKDNQSPIKPIGVIDTRNVDSKENGLPYWATAVAPSAPENNQLQDLDIPDQQYAVIPHHGPIENLHKTLEWVVHCWLPESGYQGSNGFELELYGQNYEPTSETAYMEYWLSIQRYNPASHTAFNA